MPPAKKSSVDRHFSTEVSREKKVRSWDKNVEQKRKSTNKLGPPWSETEIQKFYKAYRKHGKDWRRVAAEVSTRSMEMVEALYNLHRAYLSLPEGTASVHGLIAMLSDHYNVHQAPRRREAEDSGVPHVSHKSLKRKRVKVPLSEPISRPVSTSKDGCMSLLNRLVLDGQPRVVGKRTPRFPVTHPYTRDNQKNHGIENLKSDPVSKEEESGSSREKLRDASIQEGRMQGARSKGSNNPSYDADFANICRKGKKTKVGVIERKRLDDGEGQKFRRNVDTKVFKDKGKETSPNGESRSKKLFSSDEFSALDALQTLANLSAIESESSVQLKEETKTIVDEKTASVPQATCASNNLDTTEVPPMKESLPVVVSVVEASSSRKSKSGRISSVDARHDAEAKQQNGNLKRKRQSSVSRALKVEDDTKGPVTDLVTTKDLPVEENLPVKEEQTAEVPAPSGQSKTCSDNNDDQTNVVKSPACLTRKSRRKSKPSFCSFSLQERVASYPKEEVPFSLSKKLRRWSRFEWFCSAIDYPWFAKREFVEYLDHVGLGHVSTLTRVEWGVIRSSLGKPRRFSQHFLHDERSKLEQYRESVRKHYSELRAGIRKGLPTDLARPLYVGQRVNAIHPQSRELYTGRVLTVDHEECRVQFDHPKIGVELIKDIDCMPFDQLENMPEALKKQKYHGVLKEVEMNGHSNTENARVHHSQNDVMCGQVPATQQGNRADRFDRKLSDTRQCHTQQVNQVLHWLNSGSSAIFAAMEGPNQGSLVLQESGSAVSDIVHRSRQQAHKMVDAALQALSSEKDGEDAFATIGEALDHVDTSQSASEPRLQVTNGDDSPESQTSFSSAASSSPSELMTSCVATLLMIKMCTERQYPPADVAQMIDSAVTNLRPSCSQNLPIYREIQTCMGRIKTQILALVPT
ncbi:Protein ALWAYS EARLY 1 [Linum perenne]